MKKLFLFTLLFYGSYGYTADRIAQKMNNRPLNAKSIQFTKAVAGKRSNDISRLIKTYPDELNSTMVLHYRKKDMPTGTKRKFGRLAHIKLEERRLKATQNQYNVLSQQTQNQECKGLKQLKAAQKAISTNIQKTKKRIARKKTKQPTTLL